MEIPSKEELQAMTKDQRYEWLNKFIDWSIAIQIKEIRLKRGWTQEQLAKKIGSYQPVVARYENPNNSMRSVRMLMKFASVFSAALIIRFTSWGEMYEWIIGPRGLMKRLADGSFNVIPFEGDLHFRP